MAKMGESGVENGAPGLSMGMTVKKKYTTYTILNQLETRLSLARSKVLKYSAKPNKKKAKEICIRRWNTWTRWKHLNQLNPVA
jgi:hypothetical protein